MAMLLDGVRVAKGRVAAGASVFTHTTQVALLNAVLKACKDTNGTDYQTTDMWLLTAFGGNKKTQRRPCRLLVTIVDTRRRYWLLSCRCALRSHNFLF